MSFPNIPDVDATIDITTDEAVNLLLASIAFEELGLAHIINAEAEKIQYVLGTLDTSIPLETPPTIEELLQINQSVNQTLKNVIKKEMLLQFKLEDVITFSTTTTTTTTTSTTSTATTTTEDIVGSAWSVGTSFGNSKVAQYTTLGSEEEEKTVDLGLGINHIDIGDVEIVRSGNDLLVTLSTDSPYSMIENQLYVSDVPPTNSAPGLFPYQYTPGVAFTTHTFTVDVSAFAGETLYIAAHAKIV